ncbi:hypothetical protein ACWGOQ_0001520 [Aquimarina sp. M1]
MNPNHAFGSITFDYKAIDYEGNLKDYSLRALWADIKSALFDSKTHSTSLGIS